MNKSNKKTVLKWLNNITTGVIFVLLIATAFIVISTKASGGEPEIFGYQLKAVLSGSMEPDIQTGSIIAVKPGGDMTRFKEGDVITFMSEDDYLITHRVQEAIQSGEHTMYQTKGDNNNAADLDPVLSENVVAEYTGFTVPYAGYVIDFAQSKNGAFLLLVPGFLLICYAGFSIWQAIRMLEVTGEKSKKEKKIIA